MTRAKGKFIAVVNAHFMERKVAEALPLCFPEMLHLPRVRQATGQEATCHSRFFRTDRHPVAEVGGESISA